MCLAIPGKIIKINGASALVKYPGEKREAIISDIKVKKGDFVLVQMGIILKRLSPMEASSSLKAWSNV
jgi:hydrogenase expression/formation protein HypC